MDGSAFRNLIVGIVLTAILVGAGSVALIVWLFHHVQFV